MPRPYPVTPRRTRVKATTLKGSTLQVSIIITIACRSPIFMSTDRPLHFISSSHCVRILAHAILLTTGHYDCLGTSRVGSSMQSHARGLIFVNPQCRKIVSVVIFELLCSTLVAALCIAESRDCSWGERQYSRWVGCHAPAEATPLERGGLLSTRSFMRHEAA